jgi:hypothetical protein
MNGKGIYFYPDGRIYSGEVKKGKKNGMGKILFSSGDIYSGEFRDDTRNGKGIYFFLNGNIYSGEFVDGVFFLLEICIQECGKIMRKMEKE